MSAHRLNHGVWSPKLNEAANLIVAELSTGRKLGAIECIREVYHLYHAHRLHKHHIMARLRGLLAEYWDVSEAMAERKFLGVK